MFVLAIEDERLEHLPAFPKLEPSPPREGIYTPDQMGQIADNLPEHLRPLFWTMYVTGWRGKHVREMTWEINVDLETRELRLPSIPGNRKRSKLRMFPYGELEWFAEMIDQQRKRVLAQGLAQGGRIAWVFPSPQGEPIGDPGKAWDAAIEKAELPRYTPHVTRRSATQNLRRSGVAQRIRMALVGHSSTAMHDQYDADSTDDRAEGVRRLGAYLSEGLTRTQTRTQTETGKERQSVRRRKVAGGTKG
jgi:integrase